MLLPTLWPYAIFDVLESEVTKSFIFWNIRRISLLKCKCVSEEHVPLCYLLQADISSGLFLDPGDKKHTFRREVDLIFNARYCVISKVTEIFTMIILLSYLLVIIIIIIIIIGVLLYTRHINNKELN
jgi:hypothetical protein